MSDSERPNDEAVLVEDSEDQVPLRDATEAEAPGLAAASFAISGRWHVRADKFHSLVRTNGINPESEALKPIRRGLGYLLQAEERNGRREVALRSSWLDPLSGKRSNTKSESDETVAMWARIAQEAGCAAARAHFLDLLVLRGGKEVPRLAADAVRAYLLAGTSPISRIETESGHYDIPVSEDDHSLSLGRALSLLHIACHQPEGRDLAEPVVSAAISHARTLLDSVVPKVGGFLNLLALLAAARSRLNNEDRDAVVGMALDAMSKYNDLGHAVDQAAKVIELLNPALRDEINRKRVQARLDMAAGRDNAMVAMSFLDDAARLAADLDVSDLADEATRRMQILARDGDFGFQVFETSSSIPREIIEAQIHSLCAGATWRESLENWLDGPPPSGDVETNRASAANLATGLMDFLPSVHYGADNLPRWRSETDEEKRLERLSQFERMHLSTYGDLLALALDRIKEMHGVPPIQELALFLSGAGRGDDELAMALARSLHRYWEGDFEGSLFTAVMRVETAARRLVLLLDEPAYIVARTNNQAKYVGLGELLEILAKHGFDESWDRFIRALLLGPTGRNLRHDIAHGFRLAIPHQPEVALSLRALSLFVVLLWKPRTLELPPTIHPSPQPSWTIVDLCVDRFRDAMFSPRSALQALRLELAAMRGRVSRGPKN